MSWPCSIVGPGDVAELVLVAGVVHTGALVSKGPTKLDSESHCSRRSSSRSEARSPLGDVGGRPARIPSLQVVIGVDRAHVDVVPADEDGSCTAELVLVPGIRLLFPAVPPELVTGSTRQSARRRDLPEKPQVTGSEVSSCVEVDIVEEGRLLERGDDRLFSVPQEPVEADPEGADVGPVDSSIDWVGLLASQNSGRWPAPALDGVSEPWVAPGHRPPVDIGG